MYLIHKCGMFPFPAVFALWNAGIHVGFSNSGDMVPYVKTPVYE